MQSFLIRLAQQERIRNAFSRCSTLQNLSAHYIAGRNVSEALAIALKQNEYGLLTVLAPTRPSRPDRRQITNSVKTYCSLIERVQPSSALNEVSVNLLALGLSDGLHVARPNLNQILKTAAESQVLVTLDMGPYPQVADTIQLFHEFFPDNPTLGITIQARLHRAEHDAAKLANFGARVRVCSGVFLPPTRLGYRSKHDIDLAFVKVMRILMESPSYPMIATHDSRLIAIAGNLAHRTGRAKAEYEYQLLYGFRTIEQRRLADTGHRSRVQLPFGPNRYDYLSRRVIAEPSAWLKTLWQKR